MGIVRDLFYAKKMSAGIKLPAPSSALLLKRQCLAGLMGGEKTFTGSVVSFTGKATSEITALTAAVTPVQDLHGYDSPWPAGGGKNLLDVSQSEAGGIDASGSEISTAGNWRSTNYIPATANASYTMSITGTLAGRLRMYFYDSSKAFISPRTQGDYGATSVTGTAPANAAYMRWVIYQDGGITQAQVKAFKPMIELGSTATAWMPYSNICPITGFTGANIYVSPTQNQGDATTYTEDWTSEAGTVYAGSYEAVSGKLKSRPQYASYSGQTLVGPWLSSMDAYAAGTTPTTGAQVVDLGGTETEYTLTAQQVAALVGQNYIWADTGDVTVTVNI